MTEMKVYHCNEWHNEYTEFYMKSEADKVIAELKDKLQNVSSLLKETREWLVESQKLHKRCADNAVKVIRHHKYKRCLVMAMWCERNRIYAANFRKPRKKWDFYHRWYKRWLELADKFKEKKNAEY